jgi:hypothetical protein
MFARFVTTKNKNPTFIYEIHANNSIPIQPASLAEVVRPQEIRKKVPWCINLKALFV